jgi:hypothetical protein
MVELFIRKGRDYEPDISIFLIKHEDLYQINELWLPILQKTMAEAGNPNLEKDFLKFIKTFENSIKEYYNKYSNYNKTTWYKNSIDIPFKRLKESNPKNSKIIIFSFLLDGENNEYLKNKSKEHGFIFISHNLPQIIWEEKLSFANVYKKDLHPNKSGHKFLSNFLYVYLVSNNLIEC